MKTNAKKSKRQRHSDAPASARAHEFIAPTRYTSEDLSHFWRRLDFDDGCHVIDVSDLRAEAIHRKPRRVRHTED